MVHAYHKEERSYPKDLTQTKQALLQKLSLERKYKGRKATFTILHHAIKTTLKAKVVPILITYQAYKNQHPYGLKFIYMCEHITISPSRELLCFLESL